MNRLSRLQIACLLIGAATVAGSGNAAAQTARPGNSDVTAVPKVTGPVPVSSESFPFLAADRNLQPTDLKKYNPSRYAAVSFANPTPAAPCAGAANNAVSESEDGLKWDAISQVGALLKSNVPSRPLARLRVAALYMTAGQSPDPMTYVNAIHSHANLANGKPVYDGYLIKQPGNAARINQCAPR